MMSLVRMKVTEEMHRLGDKFFNSVNIPRTITSPYDNGVGAIGEYIWAKYFYNDIKKHNPYETKGKSDFEGEIEIKTSAHPFNDRLNLLVREDYLNKSPLFYIQIILDYDLKNGKDIPVGTEAIICGYATQDELLAAPKKDFGSKFGGKANYQCHYLPITKLKPVVDVWMYYQ